MCGVLLHSYLCRTQSIEGFLVSQAPNAAAASAAAAAAGGAVKRRRGSAAAAQAGGGSSSGLLGTAGRAAAGDGDGDDDGPFDADGLFSNASLHLQAAAAEEAAAAAELTAGDAAGDSTAAGLQQQGQELLLRPVAQLRLPAVKTQLSSIWELLEDVQQSVHVELQQLFKSHTWVGMVSPAFRALQACCTLLHCDVFCCKAALCCKVSLCIVQSFAVLLHCCAVLSSSACGPMPFYFFDTHTWRRRALLSLDQMLSLEPMLIHNSLHICLTPVAVLYTHMSDPLLTHASHAVHPHTPDRLLTHVTHMSCTHTHTHMSDPLLTNVLHTHTHTHTHTG